MRRVEIGDGTVQYEHDSLHRPETVRSNLLITSVRVVPSPGHDHVHVWNRGGKSGELVVNKGDGERIATRLLEGP